MSEDRGEASGHAPWGGGVYEKVEDAQKAMGKGFEKEYTPQSENSKQYLSLYNRVALI